MRQTARDADRAAKTLIHNAERAARRVEKEKMETAANAVKVNMANSRVHEPKVHGCHFAFFDSMGISAHGATSMSHVHSRC